MMERVSGVVNAPSWHAKLQKAYSDPRGATSQPNPTNLFLSEEKAMVDLHEFSKTVLANVVHATKIADWDYCEINMMSQLFPDPVRISLYLDQPLEEGISDRQLRLIREFVDMTSGLDEIKQALYDHWDNNSDYWAVDVDVETPEDAFALSTLVGLSIQDRDHWWGPNASQLRFSVAWDPEHGAGVFIRDGQVGEFGDL
jgi:hypothetical protein